MKTVIAKKKKKIKKKEIALVKATTLTPKLFVLREQTLRFLVDKRMRIGDVARELKTTTATIKSFFDDNLFCQDLQQRIDRINGLDVDYRIEQNKITLDSLYAELRRRFVTDSVDDASTRDIHKMIIDTAKELRLDTPGDFTAKVGVADLTDLQGRFKKSLSGKLQRINRASRRKNKKKKKPRVIDGDIIRRKLGNVSTESVPG